MTTTEQEAVLSLSLLAAFADGAQSDVERESLKRLGATLPGGPLQPSDLYRRVLLREVTTASAAAALSSPALRTLAYEMAVCVCEADDVLNEPERRFLAGLRQELQLDVATADGIEQSATALTTLPVTPSDRGTDAPPATLVVPDAAALDASILKHSILAGALELMPDSLATMAIIPLQMKLVYGIGKAHGYTLDRGHIKELLAAAGLGLTSQVVEGYARKLLGGLLGTVGGGLGRGVGKQAASSAMSFASTYALGHLARRYYGGGRTLSALQLRELFGQLTEQARSLHGRYAGQIEQQAGATRVTELLPLLQKL